MDYSQPGSSVYGILQARILEWVAIPFSKESSQPRDWTQVSCIAGRLSTIWVTRKAHINHFQKGNNERKFLSVVQLFSSVWLFVISWAAACQASLSFTMGLGNLFSSWFWFSGEMGGGLLSVGSDSKEYACNVGDLGSVPGLGRFPGEGNGNPLQYCCLENFMHRSLWAPVHRVAQSWTPLSG